MAAFLRTLAMEAPQLAGVEPEGREMRLSRRFGDKLSAVAILQEPLRVGGEDKCMQ